MAQLSFFVFFFKSVYATAKVPHPPKKRLLNYFLTEKDVYNCNVGQGLILAWIEQTNNQLFLL